MLYCVLISLEVNYWEAEGDKGVFRVRLLARSGLTNINISTPASRDKISGEEKVLKRKGEESVGGDEWANKRVACSGRGPRAEDEGKKKKLRGIREGVSVTV